MISINYFSKHGRKHGDEFEAHCIHTTKSTGRDRSRTVRARSFLYPHETGTSVHTTKSTGRDRSRTVRARSFLVERWFLETGTSVPVSPVWTRATGREPFAIDRERFGNVSCGHTLEGRHVSRGNSGMKLVLEALHRLYQEAFWACLQRRDQTDLRRNDKDKLVRDIQQAFIPGDGESARLLTRQLHSEHIATLEALRRDFKFARRMQCATFAHWDTFMQGVGRLLRRLGAERDGLFEQHIIAVCEIIPWCRAADRATTSDICLDI